MIHRIELPTPFAVGPVNAYLLQHGTENILVDCGPNTEAARSALQTGLSNHQLDVASLTGLVLTHGHVDHAGLTRYVRQHDIPVYSHPGVQTWLEPNGSPDTYRDAFFRQMYSEMGMSEDAIQRVFKDFFFMRQLNDQSVVDVPLCDGACFAPIPSLQVIEVPGHAQAAIALYAADSGELIVGDQLLKTVSANAFVEPIFGAARGEEAVRSKSLIDYRNNLLRLAQLPIQKVYPGHGVPFSDAASLIQRRLGEHVTRRATIAKLLVENQGATAWALACLLFPRHLDQPSLILSEVLGFLDWMEAEGEVEHTRTEAGIIRWTLVN